LLIIIDINIIRYLWECKLRPLPVAGEAESRDFGVQPRIRRRLLKLPGFKPAHGASAGG